MAEFMGNNINMSKVMQDNAITIAIDHLLTVPKCIIKFFIIMNSGNNVHPIVIKGISF